MSGQRPASSSADADGAPSKKRPRRTSGGGGANGGVAPSSSPRLDVPTASHYEVSLMHRRVVTRSVHSPKHGYVITGSEDGVVKFWKRTSAASSSSTAGRGVGSASKEEPPRCLEFVKSYSAHIGPVLALVVSRPDGDAAASVGADGTIKLYDVSAFDVTGMIKTRGGRSRIGPGPSPGNNGGKVVGGAEGEIKLGMHAAFIGEDQSLLAVASAVTEHDAASDDSESESDDDDGPAPVAAAAKKKERDTRLGAIYVYSTVTLSPAPVKVVRLHASPVTGLAYNSRWNCAVSSDSEGVLELWDGTVLGSSGMIAGDDVGDDDATDRENAAFASVGSPPSPSRNGVAFSSKFDTDLYALMKKKTSAVSLCVAPSGTHFAVYGRDRKVRVYNWSTCKIAVTFDEREKVYGGMVAKNAEKVRRGDKIAGDPSTQLDAIEYGKRAATERELVDTPVFTAGVESDTILSRESGSQLIQMDFDSWGRYLLLPTLLGIKVIDWKRRRSAGVIGRADAGSAGLRFLSATSCGGDAVIDRQMELARTGGSSTAVGESDGVEKKSDALVIALAYKKRRMFVFSHEDPIAAAEALGEGEDADDAEERVESALLRRDILNEAPDAEDMLMGSRGVDGGGGGGAADAASSKLGREAILRTSAGDIHMKLYPEDVPRTIENFCSHARGGYYDGVIFHRVIKGFMLQTGDPLGDGTGGESCWGGEFEDEFVRDLRHDRPFTVSMANAGPNTNGSQFFITTVPTPWLDNKHTVFGRVTRGMDVCSAIEGVKTDDGDRPLDEIKILSVDIS